MTRSLTLVAAAVIGGLAGAGAFAVVAYGVAVVWRQREMAA